VEVIVLSAEARFDCVAELWLGGERFAATQVDESGFTLAIEPRSDGSSAIVSVAALIEALREAERLLEPPHAHDRDARLSSVDVAAGAEIVRAAVDPAVRSRVHADRTAPSLVERVARRRRTTAMTILPRVAKRDQAATIAASAVEAGSVISVGLDSSVRIIVSRVTEDDGRLVLDGTNEINGTEVSLRTAPKALVVRHEAIGSAAKPVG
jgi:hypothetical protein